MTASLLVGVPVLARPANAAAAAANLRETTPGARLLFIATPGDLAELAAIDETGEDLLVVTWPAGRGDFARKHNAGYRLAVEEGFDWYFVGADDLTFHPGWLEACLAAHEKTGACVIGTKDLGNARTMNGWHATHFLVHRDYADCGLIDRPGMLLNEDYAHEFCDDECIATARWRGTYSGSAAVVEHRHPDWGKAEWDDTYRKAQAGRLEDQQLFNARRQMFARGRAPWR